MSNEETRLCPGCNQVKPLSEFYPRNRDRKCKECIIIRVARWNADNSERRKEYKRQYRQKNKERLNDEQNERRSQNRDEYLAYMRTYYENHKEEAQERSFEWKAQNLDVVRELEQRYRERHAERIKVRHKLWVANNRERARHTALIGARRRIARKKAIEGWHTIEEWLELCAFYGQQCLCCGAKVRLTADHVIPVSKNGPDWITNIQPLCRPCNSSKGTKCIDYRPNWSPEG